jgi:hypothetical protein
VTIQLFDSGPPHIFRHFHPHPIPQKPTASIYSNKNIDKPKRLGYSPYMKSKNGTLESAAAQLGRKGGKAQTEKKSAAAKENGKKGGRPRKKVVQK